MLDKLKEFRAMIGTVAVFLAAGISVGGFYHGDYKPLKQNVADNTCSRVWGKFHNENKWVRNAKAESYDRIWCLNI